MRVVECAGSPAIARVFVVELRDDPRFRVECVGAVDPALARRDKMVFVVSSQFGCPVGCAMCDAGTWFAGNLTQAEIEVQIRLLVQAWSGDDTAFCRKLKVQFARMGEPSLNPAVLDVIEFLPTLLPATQLVPCIATTAPRAASAWFERLIDLRPSFGPDSFQLQFSVQSTNETHRARMIPIDKWSLSEIASYSQRFVREGDRKVTLNAALARGVPFDPEVIARVFDPRFCLVKLTPLNPTSSTAMASLQSGMETGREPEVAELARALESFGFRCILSIGDPEESRMGTSCGQLARLATQRSAQHPKPPPS